MEPLLWLLSALAFGGLALQQPRRDERAAVVRAAVGELGKSDPRPYVEDALGRPSDLDRDWCGMFVLWAYHQAGLLPDVLWRLGSGFAGHLRQIGPSELAAGDLVYFDQPWQHHALVEWVRDGMMSTINGNGAGGRVTRVVRPVSDADAYYSIADHAEQRAAA
jgi:cell wall-associated NlpC family hydrolase